MLQEIDAWPTSSLLLAATNHSELIDPALWRRFDYMLEFPKPEQQLVTESLKRLLAKEAPAFVSWLPILGILLDGQSYSDIDRTIRQFRKATMLKTATPMELVERLSMHCSLSLERNARQDLARHLSELTRFSQHRISKPTMHFISVNLPEPFGPTTAVSVPRAIAPLRC